MSANFDFMKEINTQYFTELNEIERFARVKPREAAMHCRTLLEFFIGDVFAKHKIKKEEKLNDNLRKLLNNIWLEMPAVDHVEYDVVDMNGKVSTIRGNGLYYIKDLGNASVHEGLPTKKGDTKVVVSSAAVIKALRVFHSLFSSYYRNRLRGRKISFRDTNVPLRNYDIVKSYVPVDTERSKCVKEYIATRKTGEYSKEVRYALIREYIPSEMDSLFLNRNIDAFSESYKYTYSSGVTVEKLNEISEPYADFFIAYEFPRSFTPLDKFLKNTLSMKERVQICKRIAESLDKFHNAESPIYHRMLTYDCIMVSDFTDENDGYRPYITKFDFAKITSITEGTVFDNLSEAEAKESLKLSRYKLETVAPDSPWDKVDIYSLGVLFVDVLQKRVSTKAISVETFEELIDAGISDNMIEIIDEMLCDIPEERPDIKRILEVVNKEYSLYE